VQLKHQLKDSGYQLQHLSIISVFVVGTTGKMSADMINIRSYVGAVSRMSMVKVNQDVTHDIN